MLSCLHQSEELNKEKYLSFGQIHKLSIEFKFKVRRIIW